MRPNILGLLLVGLVLVGCVDKGRVEATAATRLSANVSMGDVHAPPSEHLTPGRTLGSREAASTATERQRTRAGLRLELSRRLRARGQYHIRVAQGIGSTEILAAMDASIGRLEAHIEELERSAPGAEGNAANRGCPRHSVRVSVHPGEAERAYTGDSVERHGCAGVLALCLQSDRCF